MAMWFLVGRHGPAGQAGHSCRMVEGRGPTLKLSTGRGRMVRLEPQPAMRPAVIEAEQVACKGGGWRFWRQVWGRPAVKLFARRGIAQW